MIKCGKCGKLYDYDKYSGICPTCARYNRPDSQEEMRADLRERYDSSPGADNPAHRHAKVHQKNRDGYRHKKDEYAPYHSTYSGRAVEKEARSGGRKKKSLWGVVIAVVIAVIPIVGELAEEFPYSHIGKNMQKAFEHVGEQFDFDGYEAAEESQVDEESVYVDSAWSTYVGTNLLMAERTNYIFVNDEQQQELEKYSVKEGYVCYVISISVKNNGSEDYDLTNTNLSFFRTEDGEPVECIMTFQNVHPIVESGEYGYGYIDCLVTVPEETEEITATCSFYVSERTLTPLSESAVDIFLYREE